MLLDYEKLFEPYTADGHTVERSIGWVKREGLKRGVPAETIETAIHLIFMEVANGKTYPVDKCPCGCGIDKAGTAITHAILRQALNLDREQRVESARVLNDSLNRRIIGHIEAQNAEYTELHMAPDPEPIAPEPGKIRRAWSKLWEPTR
jgi:hypothetical protein